MPVPNQQIATIFNEIAEILAIQRANPFRVRAYQRAAIGLENLPQSVAEMVKKGKDLTDLPGIGKDLAAKIQEIVKTGHLQTLEDLKRKVPEGVLQLLKIPSLGPKRVQRLYQTLHIKNLEDLKKSIQEKKIRKLEGFGEKTEQRIAKELALRQNETKRFLWFAAQQMIQPLLLHLKKIKTIDKILLAGSFRRHKETVGDIDILVTSPSAQNVIDRFVRHEDVESIVSKGETQSTVILHSGLQVDLRVVAPQSYGAALLYFTGSKAHNIALRKLALERGFKINEYGLFKTKQCLAGKTEDEIYKVLGMSFIPPELREDQGEIEAARKKNLPHLITINNLRGDLHVHTDASDGQASLEEMAAAAHARGLEYIAITDHSKHLGITHGLDVKHLARQIQMIDQFNTKSNRITLLKGCEVDILEDGCLALPDDILKRLDLTVCAIHSQFHLDPKKQTERIVRAMKNPYFTILGHPTGRLLAERLPYEVNMEEIIKAAKTFGKFLEVNAQPKRLDLDDRNCRLAKEMGVTLVISSDAHSIDNFDYLSLGVSQAARGWIEDKNVLNSRSCAEVRKMLVAAGK